MNAIIEMLDKRISKLLSAGVEIEKHEENASSSIIEETKFLMSLKKIIQKNDVKQKIIVLDLSQIELLGECMMNGIMLAFSHGNSKEKKDYEMLMNEINKQVKP